MDEIIQIKVSGLPVAESLDNLAILGIDLDTNATVQALMSLLRGLDGKEVELQKTATHVQWRLEGGSWANLVSLSDLKGDAGANIELQKTATHVQWRVAGSGTWANLIPLDDLKGAKGDPFEYSDFTPAQIEGLKVKGDTGENIELNVTSTHIQWRVAGTSAWNNLIALSELKGAKGDDATEVEFQKTATHIQWRRVGGTWADLVPLSDLKGNKGDDGKEVELQKTATHLQWRLEGGSWANLVALADLKGDTGATPLISVGTVQTVAPGGQSSAEIVDDGATPEGVKKYKLNLVLVQGATGTVENIDSLAITFAQAAARENINTGDTFAILFGKIKKWFTDLKGLAFKDKVSWTTDIDDRPSIPSKVSDLTNDSGYLTATAAKSVKVDNAGNADTVGGKTVAVNVPANAQFTDTTYEIATGASDGLMARGDKTVVDFIATMLDDDDQGFIDTLAEILDVFSTYPEGVDIMSKFAEKVDKETGKRLLTNTEAAKITEIDGKMDANKFQAVAELPASPDSNTFYFIPE